MEDQAITAAPTICLTCTHWEFKDSPLRHVGFGLCAKEAGIFRRARTFSPSTPCAKKSHSQADSATITAREKALQRI